MAVDPNLQDMYGNGPQIGAPYVKLGDTEWAITTWFQPFINLGTVGLMMRKPINGAALWNIYGTEYCKYQTVAPDPNEPADRTLSLIIEAQGGPVPFIFGLMAHCMKIMADYYGTSQAITFNPTTCDTQLMDSLSAWMIRVYSPSNPVLLLAQAE